MKKTGWLRLGLVTIIIIFFVTIIFNGEDKKEVVDQTPKFEHLFNGEKVSQDSLRIYYYYHTDFWFKDRV